MTIGTVDMGLAALPEQDPRRRRTTTGIDAAGTTRALNVGAKVREIVLVFRRKTLAKIQELETFLFTNDAATIAITPDAHIDLGNGNGTVVNAKWIDDEFTPIKQSHENWMITLKFRKI